MYIIVYFNALLNLYVLKLRSWPFHEIKNHTSANLSNSEQLHQTFFKILITNNYLYLATSSLTSLLVHAAVIEIPPSGAVAKQSYHSLSFKIMFVILRHV